MDLRPFGQLHKKKDKIDTITALPTSPHIKGKIQDKPLSFSIFLFDQNA